MNSLFPKLTVLSRLAVLFVIVGFTPTDGYAEKSIQVQRFDAPRRAKKIAKKIRSSVVKMLHTKRKLIPNRRKGIIRGHVYWAEKKIRIILYDNSDTKFKSFVFRVTQRGLSQPQKRKLARILIAAIRSLPKKSLRRAKPDSSPKKPQKLKRPSPVPKIANDNKPKKTTPVPKIANDNKPQKITSVPKIANDNKPQKITSVPKIANDDNPEADNKLIASPPEIRITSDNRPGVEFSAGAIYSKRSFGFGEDFGNYLGPSIAPRFTVALYPWAIGNDRSDWLHKLGVEVRFERSVGLASKVRGASMESSLPTSQRRLDIRIQHREQLGRVQLVNTLGLEKLSFTVDKSTTPVDLFIVTPNTAYSSITSGAKLTFPTNSSIRTYLDTRAKVVLPGGEITTAEYYGDGFGLGVDADLGIEFALADLLVFRGGIQYTYMKLYFEENGALSVAGDFSSAADTYLSGYLTLGFRL